MNLDTGERKSYEFDGREVASLIPGEDKEVLLSVYSAVNPDDEDLFEDSFEFVRLNIEEGTETLEGSKLGEWIAHYRDGMAYTEDEFCVYKYCPETWKKETIINVLKEMPVLKEEEYKSNVWNEISFCDDYITIEVYYYSDQGEKDHSELLVYDYNGGLVCREKLW